MSSSVIMATSVSGHPRRLASLYLGLLVATAVSVPLITASARHSSHGQPGYTSTMIGSEDVWIDAFDMEMCGRGTFRPWQEQESAFDCSSSYSFESQAVGWRHQNDYPELLHNSIVGPRIVNGVDALEGEFPYYAHLVSYAGAHCGATLIHKNYLVTAAHCVQHASGLYLTLGTNMFNGMGGQIRKADKWCYSADYHKVVVDKKLRKCHHDLAIIRLKEPIEYELNKIWPACLKLDARHSPATTCAFVGHGLTGIDSWAQQADYLQTLPAQRSCELLSGFEDQVSCYNGTAKVNGTQGAFKGDSGSAVICYDHCAEDSRTQAFAVAAQSIVITKQLRIVSNHAADFSLLRPLFLNLLKAISLEGSLNGTKCFIGE